MTTAAAKIAAAVNARTETEAAAVYSGLRLIVMGARRDGEKAPQGAADAMVLAGDALEARIGEDRFSDLMNKIDAHVYA
jgi:hypothetical protein